MNLYQKFRPFSWEAIYGNQKSIKELQKRAKEDKIPSALFIAGLSGSGKSTIARLLSACITCENLNKETGNPCGKCKYCEDILNENFSLATHYYNASNLAIEDMRNIDREAITRSLTSRKKIIIIDEMQELHNNKKAMKNILVTLERVSKDVTFILLAMDDSKVDTAIKNRCVYYRLGAIDSSDIAKYLKFICDSEGVKLTDSQFPALFTIAENCGGSVRTAVSFLERCLEGDIWEEQEIIKELGLISQSTLVGLCDKLLRGDVSILETEINVEILGKIRWLVATAYKEKAGIELNGYYKKSIGNLSQTTTEEVFARTIEKLNSINNFIYSDAILLESLVLDICLYNKKNVPKRRLHG
jgi:DNA polymerase-3 subunit gamma/tau